MRLTISADNGNVVSIACEGDISLPGVPSSGIDPMEQLLGSACFQRQVVFDLTAASFIDSSGVGWLMQCHSRFRNGGGKLILHSAPGMVDQVLRLLRLQSVLQMAADRAAALAIVGAAQVKP